MTIIAFISQKGGVGKSTLSRALAREAVKSGLSVKIADLDTQQGTSVKWNLRRLDASVDPTFSVEGFKRSDIALAEADRYDLLILDAPARSSEGTLRISEKADLVVQPTNPAVDDLEPAVLVFHELVKEGIPKSKLVFALNHVLTDAEEAAARDYLTQAGYAVLKGCLFSRTSYREAQNNGRTITETRHSGLNVKADALIEALIDMVDVDG